MFFVWPYITPHIAYMNIACILTTKAAFPMSRMTSHTKGYINLACMQAATESMHLYRLSVGERSFGMRLVLG